MRFPLDALIDLIEVVYEKKMVEKEKPELAYQAVTCDVPKEWVQSLYASLGNEFQAALQPDTTHLILSGGLPEEA